MEGEAGDRFEEDCLIHVFGTTSKQVRQHIVVAETSHIHTALIIAIISILLCIFACKVVQKVLESLKGSSLNVISGDGALSSIH